MINFEKLTQTILNPVKRPLYVRIFQEGPILKGNTPRPEPKHISECNDEEVFSEYPELRFGSAIYLVEEDGSLRLIEQNWDSSD